MRRNNGTADDNGTADGEVRVPFFTMKFRGRDFRLGDLVMLAILVAMVATVLMQFAILQLLRDHRGEVVTSDAVMRVEIVRAMNDGMTALLAEQRRTTEEQRRTTKSVDAAAYIMTLPQAERERMRLHVPESVRERLQP